LLSRAFDYALRSLTHLARAPRAELRLARQLADELALPPAFLGKLLQPLVQAGLLESHRGRSGGFRLARAPEEVRLVEVLEVLDERGFTPRCVLGGGPCDDAEPCPVHELWAPGLARIRAALESWTLADLVRWCDEHPGARWPALSEPADDPEPQLNPGAGRAPARARA
jgi:Rrf2 family protein